MGDINHSNIRWKDKTARQTQSRRFQTIDDNFLLQVVEEPTNIGAMLDLVLTNKVGLVGNVKLKGSLGCSGHEMVDSNILRAMSTVHSKLTTLDLREQTLVSLGICSVEYHRIKTWRERGPRNLVNIQGSPPPSSGAMHLSKEEVRQKL